jgi:hypothetical protein
VLMLSPLAPHRVRHPVRGARDLLALGSGCRVRLVSLRLLMGS